MVSLISLALMGAQQPVTIVPVPRPDKWWQDRHAAIVARANKGDIRLAFIGDSITHSFGGEPQSGESWNNVGNTVWAKHYAKRSALNLGMSGDGTQHVLWRLQNGELGKSKPKVIVIMIGTNNLPPRPAAEAALGVKTIVEWLRKNQSQARLVVHSIFPRGLNADHPLRRKVVEANKMISRDLTGVKGVWYLDNYATFLNPDGVLEQSIMPDGLHPNERGYQMWADSLEPLLKRWL
jgi:lysophospholipase L1-like esterase